MKFTFVERKQKGFPDLPLLAATQNHGVILKSKYENRTVEATKALGTLKLVEPGDFVISLRSFQGGLEIAYDRGIISPAYTILVPTHITREYFKYYAKSPEFISILRSTVTGIREGQNIDYNRLREYYLEIPSVGDQIKMGEYLDAETGKIDKAIAAEEKMIALLQERREIIINEAVGGGGVGDDFSHKEHKDHKDEGGVLSHAGAQRGEARRGWKIKKLKTILKCFGRIGFRGYGTNDIVDENEGAISLSPSNINEWQMDFSKCTYLSWQKYNESPEIIVGQNDIIFVKTGASFGKCALIERLPKECTINPQLVIFKEIKENTRYLMYLLQTEEAKRQVNLSVIGGTIPTIAQSKIDNYAFIFPPLPEQERIVKYLDAETGKIDRAIEVKRRQIALLRERREIVINEVVTGRVPGLAKIDEHRKAVANG